jgi:hypothetical protein
LSSMSILEFLPWLLGFAINGLITGFIGGKGMYVVIGTHR